MIEWLAGILAFVAGLVAVWVRGWLLWLVPVSYPQAGRFLRFRWVELFRWPVVAKQEGRFLVLVCCLEGDDATDSAMRVVARALRTEASLQPVLDWRRISLGDSADQTRAELRARERAVQVGRQYRADVIVWGEVAKAGEGLRLHFHGADQLMPPRDLTISKGFLDAAYREPLYSLLGLIAATTALAEVAALTNTGSFVADRLEPLAQRLQQVLDAPPPGLDAERRAELHGALGLALFQIGEQRGDKELLREAVAAFDEALKEYTRERTPVDWAKTQHNLGCALFWLGVRGDEKALRGAVIAFREALTGDTCERMPLAWAKTHSNLGAALASLGERGHNQELLDAVTAFRKALMECTRERAPLDWAATQNNLGAALGILGQRGDEQAMRDAVTAFREALKEFTRERAPLDWAATQNNLGNALRALGERGDGQSLRDAVSAYRESLKETTRERVPLDWALTQENLALALNMQAERSGECSLIAEALAAIGGAIEEFARRDAPDFLARARRNRDVILATARRLGCP